MPWWWEQSRVCSAWVALPYHSTVALPCPAPRVQHPCGLGDTAGTQQGWPSGCRADAQPEQTHLSLHGQDLNFGELVTERCSKTYRSSARVFECLVLWFICWYWSWTYYYHYHYHGHYHYCYQYQFLINHVLLINQETSSNLIWFKLEQFFPMIVMHLDVPQC